MCHLRRFCISVPLKTPVCLSDIHVHMSKEEELIPLTIAGPDGVRWERMVKWLSSENSEGPFDILADHANFMTLLENVPVNFADEEGETHIFNFERAVLWLKDGGVKIYVHSGSAQNQ